MKKSLFVLVCLSLLLVLFSCSPDSGNGTATLNIVINSAVRAIEPNISLKTNQYNVTLYSPDGTVMEFSLNKEVTETSKKDLPVGTWTAKVDALNADGTVIGTGTASAELKANQTGTVYVTVSEVSGEGTLTVTIDGDNPNNSTYTLNVYKNEKGTDTLVKTQQFATEDDVLKAQVTLTNGFYFFKITSSNSTETCPAPEAVRIVKGDSVSASFSIKLLETGDGVVVINNAIVQNPTLTLSVSSSHLHKGESATITAKGLEGDNYKYEWYIDRQKVEGETSTLTIDSVGAAGEYEVSCLVKDTDSGLVWSKSTKFKVYDVNYKPQTITVNGEVEFYLASDVLAYSGTRYTIKNASTGDSITEGRHSLYTFTEDTNITAELTDMSSSASESYYYYFEERFLEEKNRTLIYVVIDKDIEEYGYVTVNTGDIGIDLNAENQVYYGKLVASNLYIPGLPYNSSRTLKLEPGTYSVNNYGHTGSNWGGLVYPRFDVNKIAVKEGETGTLNLSADYTTLTFKNDGFVAGSEYCVGAVLSGDGINSRYITAESGILKANVGTTYDYDEIIIWDESYDNYFKVASSDIPESGEISVVFKEAKYTDSGLTLPAGRMKIEIDSETLLSCPFGGIMFRLSDTSGNILRTQELYLQSNEFNYSSTTKLSYCDFLEKGYDISVNMGTATDSSGEYTAVKIVVNENLEDYGTLAITFDISEFDFVNSYRRTAVTVDGKSSGSTSLILVNSTGTKTLRVKPDTYSRRGYWSTLTDSSGKKYYPVSVPEEFTVKSGETTAITIKLEEKI